MDSYDAFGMIIKAGGKNLLACIGEEWMRLICLRKTFIIEHIGIGISNENFIFFFSVYIKLFSDMGNRNYWIARDFFNIYIFSTHMH